MLHLPSRLPEYMVDTVLKAKQMAAIRTGEKQDSARELAGTLKAHTPAKMWLAVALAVVLFPVLGPIHLFNRWRANRHADK